ncbi:hypothetical protein HpBGD104_11130 [Helicobacter pylori]
MKGISLIKIKFKGYALEFKKKKNDPTKDENKKGLRNNKNPSQSELFEK